MFSPVEVEVVDLDFLKPDWYLPKKPLSSRCFRRRFSMTHSRTEETNSDVDSEANRRST